MSVHETKAFELTTTVFFPTINSDDIESFAKKLDLAVGEIITEFHTAEAYLVTPILNSSDISYGIRFIGADPRYMADMADEILERAVDLVAQREGISPLEPELEETTLVRA